MPGLQDIISDDAGVAGFLESVSDAPFLALDTETTGLDPLVDHVLLVQIGTGDRQAVIDAQAVGPAAIAPMLAPERIVVLHHAKFDLKMLASLGVPRGVLARANVVDTMLNERLLRNGRRSELVNGRFDLATLAQRYAGMTLDKTIRAGFVGTPSVAALGEAEIRYAERDVEATWKVFSAQLPKLESQGLTRAAAIEGGASWAFAEMELTGFPIDTEAWRALLAEEQAEADAARERLDEAFESVSERDLFGVRRINYDSDQEVLESLNRMGLELDTSRRAAMLATGHPAAAAVVTYREHQKIVSTYGERFLEHRHPKTGRLHSDWRPIGAATGRASSKDPNLQNIPRGSKFRACFRGPGDRKLVTADYAGAELRILAEAVADPAFVRVFSQGGDLHSIVASRMFGQPVSKTDNPQLRERAKQINFGLAYGMGAAGLAAQTGSSVREAEGLLDRYFQAYPAIRGYLERSARQALEDGYAMTLSGRRLWFTDLRRQRADAATLTRIAKNMPIQGTNADMTKLAMKRLTLALAEERLDAQLVNMVHDEVVVETSAADAEAVRGAVVREMVSAGAEFVRRVPVEVEATIADAWAK